MNTARRTDYGIAQKRPVPEAEATRCKIGKSLRDHLIHRGFDAADVDNPDFTILEGLAQQLRDWAQATWLVRAPIAPGMDLEDAVGRIAAELERMEASA